MFTIYKITNIQNGKIYIGQTSKTIKERLRMHIQSALTFGLNTHFSRAIRIYGSESFIIEPILENVGTKNEANEKEIYYIKLYNSTNQKIGYNSTPGGEGGNTYLNKSPEEMKVICSKISKNLSGEHNGNHTVIFMKDMDTDIETRFGSYADCERFFESKGYSFKRRIYVDNAKDNLIYGIQRKLFGRYIFRFENDVYKNISDFNDGHRVTPFVSINNETNEVFFGVNKSECLHHFNVSNNELNLKENRKKYTFKRLEPYEFKKYLG
jgi:hypothetical protein